MNSKAIIPGQDGRVSLNPGDELNRLAIGPITREQIAMYADASGDHNAIHIDPDFARQAGLDGVIVHGMFSMGILSRLLTPFAPQATIESISTRFSAMVPVNSTLHCIAVVAAVNQVAEGLQVNLNLSARLEDEVEIAAGTATLTFKQ